MAKHGRRLCILMSIVVFFSFMREVPVGAASPWYRKNPIIMHAGGGVNKTTYTNSKEALQAYLKKGKKVFEIDFKFTTDNVLVCAHDWNNAKNKRQSLQELFRTEALSGFTALTASEVIKILAAKKGTYLVVDVKEKDIKKVYQAIYQACIDTGNKSFLKRIIPQIYQTSQYKTVKSVYKFKNWIFTTYRLKPKTDKDYKKIAKFCKKNGIKVVTIPKGKVTANRVKILKSCGLVCMTHTVNDKSTYNKMKKLGVAGIYSDFLTK